MSLTPEEMRLHRQLLALFNEYIKHNLRWEDKHFDRDAVRARKALRQLIDVAYLRWKEINNARGKWEEEPLTISNEAFRNIVRKNSKAKTKEDNNSST